MKLKKCTKCKETFPATAKYFYRSKTGKDGLYASCKECIKRYQNKYYATDRPKEEKPAEIHMTLDSCKEKILSKYFAGQVVNLRFRTDQGKIMARKKAKILKFYPHHVLCEVDNCRECFTYADLNGLTTYRKGKNDEV